MSREAYKVVTNKHGVFVEPRAWLTDCHFGVDLFKDKRVNRNIAKFVCEKMNRAFRTGRRVERDAHHRLPLTREGKPNWDV